MKISNFFKNILRRFLGIPCCLCGRKALSDELVPYYVNNGLGFLVCKECLRKYLPSSLRNLWFRDPVNGVLLGTSHYCPNCDKKTFWYYIFKDEAKSKPIGAYCTECGYRVDFQRNEECILQGHFRISITNE